jgi:histidinol-phosphate aminotransferase
MRIGYAVAGPETIKAMARWQLPTAVSTLSAAAALATVGDKAHIDRERTLNHAARDFTRQSFETAGYSVVPSNANFMMVDIRRDTKEFQSACLAWKLVGRPFLRSPPMRISIGTMDEMQRATEIVREVLRMA